VGELKLDYDLMKGTTDALHRQADLAREVVSSLKQSVNSLQDVWWGSARRAFDSASGVWLPILEATPEELDRIALVLTWIHTTMQEAEEQASAQVQASLGSAVTQAPVQPRSDGNAGRG
jgi:WXG100 family type VII secretion target